jgi:hypothetical protein
MLPDAGLSTLAFCLLTSALCLRANAQSYSIDWFTIDGGGGTGTGGVYSVTGTIGQPDASGTMTGGVYSVESGFWPGAYAVQIPGGPFLSVARAGPNVIVSWTPATPGFVLQHASMLSTQAWLNAPSGATNPVTIPASSSLKFYRLLKP